MRAVQQAYVWQQSPGGGFVAFLGTNPPALLMSAIELYGNEVATRQQHEAEQREAARESARNSATRD